MGRERWFRGGHEGRERPFDWYTLAKERDIPLEQAHVLYEEALRRARAHQSPHRNAEALYLELLEEAHQEAWRPSPGKVSRTMLLTAERSGKKRPKPPKPLAPGKRTLTSYLEPPDHVRRNAKRAEQERERLEAIAESFRTLGMPLPADLQSALARVKQAEPAGQAPEVVDVAEVDNLASPDATTRTDHPARERLVPGTAAYRRFQANLLAAHGHFEELDALDAEEERLEAEAATTMEASQPTDEGKENTTDSDVDGWPLPAELQSTLEQDVHEQSTTAWKFHAAEGLPETSAEHAWWPAEDVPFQAQVVDEEEEFRPLPAVAGRPVESWGMTGPIQAAGLQGGPEEPLNLPAHGGGAELPEDVRRKMEAAFDVDFSAVRIHEGPQARSMGALAYTQGTDIHFSPGQYQPGSHRGQELLGHELAHVVQQSQGRVAATGSAKSVPLNDDPALEKEADELGAAAARMPMPPAMASFAPAAPAKSAVIQRQEEEEPPSSAEERAEAIYDAFHGSSWSEDEAKALAQIRNQSLDELRQIRSHYSTKYRRKLETEYQEYCDASEAKAALTILFPILPIQDKLRLESDLGIFGTENEGAILEILKTSNAAELAVLSADASIMGALEGWLSAQEYYEALKLIRPRQMYENVKWRVEHAEGTFNDDENAVYQALLELSPSDRKRMWDSDEVLFSFLSDGEKESVRVLCTGTEAEALSEGMRLATEGAGTEDDLVAQVASNTAAAATRERDLRTELAAGDVSDDRRSEIEAELTRLGDISGKLLRAEYVDGELREGSFLDLLEGDVGDSEFGAFTKDMGVSDFDRAKQMILDAPGAFNDDEDAIYRALESVGDQNLRDALMADQEVKAALADAFNDEEMESLAGFAEGNSYEIAIHKLEEAYSGIDTDENEIFRILLSMSAKDRELLKSRRPPIYVDLTTNMDSDEIPLINEAINTGRISTDAALEYAMGGDWDGTNEDLIRQTFERMTAEERQTYRLGYFLSKGGAVPEEFADATTQEQALVAFDSLRRRLGDELGTDDLQGALDQMLGVPTLDEMRSEPGRAIASTIMHDRVLEKGEIRDESTVSSWFVDLFSETGGVADQAEVAFRSAYRLAVENGNVSDIELVMLGALQQNFDQHYAEHVAAVDQVAEIASTVAAIVVAVAAVIATGGAATPGAVAVLAKLGVGTKVAIAATAAGITKLGVAEAVGGEHHDAVSTEGLTNLAVGGVEGAMAVLSAGIANSLAKSFQACVGLRGAALTGELTVAATRAGNTGLRALGSRATMGGLEAAIDGALSGAAGEVVMTALDEETWRRSVWDAALRFGWSIIRGASIGAATGAVTGGLLESLAHALSVRRFNRLIQHLQSTGQSLDELDKLTLIQVRTLGDIDQAVGRGELAAAEEAFGQLGSQLDDGLADALRRALFETHLRTVDELVEAIRGRVLMNSKKFSLRYSKSEMRRIIARGREKGLTEDQIEDLIFVGCRREKPISASDLTRQMDNYVNQILDKGFPFRFKSKDEFNQFKAELQTSLDGVGLPTDDVRIQGSALRNPDAADVDIAVFMDQETFNQKLGEFFGDRAKLSGAKIDIPTTGEELETLAAKIAADAAGPQEYNAPARSLMYAIQHNKIRPQDVPGLRSAKNKLQGTYGELDVSVMVRGGEFDMRPFLQIGGGI